MIEHLSLVNWNVRGLNDRARHTTVHAMVDRMRCSIVCLQESKLAAFTDADRMEIVGAHFDRHAVLNADGTRGGVLLCWQSESLTASGISVREFSITVCFTPSNGGPFGP